MAECPLTSQQLTMVGYIADGLRYKQIAERESLAVSTVRSHLHKVYGKLGVTNGAQAVLACVRAGWLDLSPPGSTQRLLHRVAESVEGLVGCIESRRRVTPNQRRYLAAFDRLVRARTPEDSALARSAMNDALGPVLQAAGVEPRSRKQRDLVELLVAYVNRSRVN